MKSPDGMCSTGAGETARLAWGVSSITSPSSKHALGCGAQDLVENNNKKDHQSSLLKHKLSQRLSRP